MKTLYKLFSLVAFFGLLSSCNSEPEYYTLKDYPDQMHIKADVKEGEVIYLTKDAEATDAITFTWDKAVSPLDPKDEVTYSIRLYDLDNDKNATEFIEVGTETTYTYSVFQLNSIIGRWVPAGSQCRVVAQVAAEVHNKYHYVKPQVSTVQFIASGYERFSPAIYMHLYDADTEEETVVTLNQTNLGSGVYMAQVKDLVPCEYWFTTSSEESYPAYGLDSERVLEKGTALSLVMDGEVARAEYDDFGTRTVLVDLNDEYVDVRFMNILLPPSGALYIVGDGCSIGWHNDASSEAKFVCENERNPHILSWTGAFNSTTGEHSFKVLSGTSYDTDVFFAPVAGADPAENHDLLPYRKQDNGGDLKWTVTTDGTFKFTLYLDADDLHTSWEAVE